MVDDRHHGLRLTFAEVIRFSKCICRVDLTLGALWGHEKRVAAREDSIQHWETAAYFRCQTGKGAVVLPTKASATCRVSQQAKHPLGQNTEPSGGMTTLGSRGSSSAGMHAHGPHSTAPMQARTGMRVHDQSIRQCWWHGNGCPSILSALLIGRSRHRVRW